jgi:hypothetical protein
MSKDRVIICMKWGTLYPASYVNVLYTACRANITGDFKFVCLTEDATGLDPAIISHPIPDLDLDPFHWKKGGWPKLAVFAQDFFGLTGRALFIDLDTVITGSLDPFFDYNAPKMVAIDTGPTWGVGAPDAAPLAGTGIFTFDLGAHSEILDHFMANRDAVVAQHRIEQIYVQSMVRDMAFWPADWVLSFKYHLRQPALVGLVKSPPHPKPENRVIAFHGEPRPIDLVNGGLWGIGPNWGLGRVKWMVDYWRRHGGEA